MSVFEDRPEILRYCGTVVHIPSDLVILTTTGLLLEEGRTEGLMISKLTSMLRSRIVQSSLDIWSKQHLTATP